MAYEIDRPGKISFRKINVIMKKKSRIICRQRFLIKYFKIHVPPKVIRGTSIGFKVKIIVNPHCA